MPRMMPSKQNGAAFTLIELMVVLGCVALLSLIVLPAFAASKVHSAQVGCLANLRRLQMAAELYRAQNGDALLPNSLAGVSSGWLGSVGSENL